MTLLVHLRIVGCMLLALAGMHVFLPGRLNWNEELRHVSLLNRQIFLVHTFFIALVLTMMGVLSLFCGGLLLAGSPLSHVVLGGLALFWITRLVVQWFVYDKTLWRGDRFNTRVHLLFSALWAYFSAVYGAALWAQFQR
jgi:hypothetical protein